MIAEKTQIKFAKSEQTGELIGFVSRHSKTQKLMGVREDSYFGKKICVLSEELKGTIQPNKLYAVELKPMHNGSGYVVVTADPIRFTAQVDTLIVPKSIYQVTVQFGNKTVFFDPKDGKTASSRTLAGVVKLLNERDDIESPATVIEDLTRQATLLVRRMSNDGFYLPDYTLK